MQVMGSRLMSPSPVPTPGRKQAAADKAEARALARSPAQAFRIGMLQSLPLLFVLLPFALLFGVVSVEAGINIPQILGFSVLVLAGASQFTAVQLLSDNAPTWIVILSGLAVNLRMAMYSASLVPWLRGTSPSRKAWIAYTLVDQTYALAIQHYERHPKLGLPQRTAYFLGAATGMCIPWVLASWLGAVLGSAISDDIALDFALPICFLAMIAPMLRTIAHMAACFVAIVTALVFSGLPSGLGMMLAAPLGMAAGAVVEVLMERQKKVRE